MSKKRNLKNLKSLMKNNLLKRNIEVSPIKFVKNTKNKITNFFEDYKKNKERR